MQSNTKSLVLGFHSQSHEYFPFQVANQKLLSVDVVESNRSEISVDHRLEVSNVDFHLI